jgi:hypothetical protein
MAAKKPVGVLVTSIASMLIGLLITLGLVAEFTIAFDFGLVELIRLVSLIAFFAVGISLWRCQRWARAAFLVLLGVNAILSLAGLYFFSFPLTIIPGPGSQRAYLRTSLLMGWLPFVVALFFLTRRSVSASLRDNK